MYRNILVPIDGSEASMRGLAEAIRLARAQPTTLHLVHVVDDYPLMVELSSARSFAQSRARRLAIGEELLEGARKRAVDSGIACTCTLLEAGSAPVVDLLLDEAARGHCGLVVIGTHGRKGLDRLALGSTAEQVVRSSPVPVLLVKLPEQQP